MRLFRVKRAKLKKQKSKIDSKLFFLTVGLTVLGIIAVADASAPSALSTFSDKFYFAKQQVLWGIVGIFAMLVATKINYSFWEKAALPIFAGSLLLLIAVLIPSLGLRALGARRWILIGPISVQPAELIKLSVAIYFAKVSAKEKKLLAFLVPLGLVSFLIMLQPDLGTTLVVGAIGFSQIFVSGVNLTHFFLSIFSGGLISILLIITSSYRKERLLTFLQQTQDPLGKGYHIRQILFALGTGGLFGVGLGQSRQKYLFLPEAATDSIFAIIAEEAGFIGAMVVIILFAVYISRGLKIASQAPDKFGQTLAVGIVAWIGGQAFLNLASMVALVPLTGIPLPFISYGGSSLTTALFATGILLNISKHGRAEKKK